MSRTPRRLMLAIAAATFSLTALGASGPSSAATASASAAYPMKVVAANGTITIPAKPTAIVSMSPTATEMLYAIGAGSQVKAVDKYSDYPASAPHTDLDGNNPNVEAIASYKPDLVVASDEAPGLDKQLNELGIPVLSDPAAPDLSQEYAQFEELGKATGHEAQAGAEVTKIKSEISKIVQSLHKSARPL